MTIFKRLGPVLAMLVLGCGAGSGSDPGDGVTTGSGSAALACFHTATAVECEPLGDGDDASTELRQRVDDFYPAACLDGDHDSDGIPDYLDLDYLGTPADDDGTPDQGGSNDDDGTPDQGGGNDDDGTPDQGGGNDDDGTPDQGGGNDDDGGLGDDDHLACQQCNRGPGNAGDFRLKIEEDRAELERGKVYIVDGDVLTVPTPGGAALSIALTAETEVRDGIPTPGAEIRVRGYLDADGALVARELRVLCPGPTVIDDEEVPDGADPIDPGTTD